METSQLVLQGGAIVVLLLGFGALMRGDLRTKQEVETLRDQLSRVNGHMDTLLPAMQTLAQSVRELNAALDGLIEQLNDRDNRRERS